MPPIDVGFLPVERLQTLLDALRAQRRLLGPRVRDAAIVLDDISHVDELPRGVVDEQAPGSYHLDGGGGDRLFDWANGPQALKPLVFVPRETLWQSRRVDGGAISFHRQAPDVQPSAVLGVRACDLAALALTDAHFLGGPVPDPCYAARRSSLLLVVVNCARPAGTCFCASTGDGPHASTGFDLCLTELDGGFLVQVGSEAGQRLAVGLALDAPSPAQRDARVAQAAHAVALQRRALPGRDLQDALFANLEHPRWDDVAARCLSCGNCTSVCPTCFCHATADVPELGGGVSEHVREWDSCFTQRHCEMHGYKVRPHVRQRYRQWLTHKLGSWHRQFGRSGCVGCGRCIAWCPAGIDVTEEAAVVCAGSDG
jgi:ferredoxin